MLRPAWVYLNPYPTDTNPPHPPNPQVERALTIKVAFQDAKGKAKTKKFRDWEARIFQHEYDHLDGVVYIDRLSPEGREKVCACVCVLVGLCVCLFWWMGG